MLLFFGGFLGDFGFGGRFVGCPGFFGATVGFLLLDGGRQASEAVAPTARVHFFPLISLTLGHVPARGKMKSKSCGATSRGVS
jgi:hypothetical protein